MNDRRRDLISFFLFVLLSSLIILHFYGSINLFTVAFLASLSIFSSLLFYAIIKSLDERISLSILRKKFITAMHLLLEYHSYNIPLYSSLLKIIKSSEDRELNEILLSLSKKEYLEGAEKPFHKNFPKLSKIFGDSALPLSLKPSALQSFTEKIDSEAQEKASSIEQYSQKYATINMFLSSVLPSFIIFGFVGSSIISQGNPSLLTFSVIMLFALPVLYAFGNSRLNGRLNG